jgi:hypothetical protein
MPAPPLTDTHRGRFRVVDPDAGGDMRLEVSPGREFSSLAQRVLVIEGDNIDWLACASEVDRLLKVSAPATFVFYRPWAPHSQRKVEQFVKALQKSVSDMDPVQFVTFTDRTTICEETLKLASSLGNGSGVWMVGSCFDSSKLARCIRSSEFLTDDTLFIAAGCVCHIGAVLALDEGGRSYLFVSVADTNTSLVRTVIDLLQNVADRDQTR